MLKFASASFSMVAAIDSRLLSTSLSTLVIQTPRTPDCPAQSSHLTFSCRFPAGGAGLATSGVDSLTAGAGAAASFAVVLQPQRAPAAMTQQPRFLSCFLLSSLI